MASTPSQSSPSDPPNPRTPQTKMCPSLTSVAQQPHVTQPRTLLDPRSDQCLPPQNTCLRSLSTHSGSRIERSQPVAPSNPVKEVPNPVPAQPNNALLQHGSRDSARSCASTPMGKYSKFWQYDLQRFPPREPFLPFMFGCRPSRAKRRPFVDPVVLASVFKQFTPVDPQRIAYAVISLPINLESFSVPSRTPVSVTPAFTSWSAHVQQKSRAHQSVQTDSFQFPVPPTAQKKSQSVQTDSLQFPVPVTAQKKSRAVQTDSFQHPAPQSFCNHQAVQTESSQFSAQKTNQAVQTATSSIQVLTAQLNQCHKACQVTREQVQRCNQAVQVPSYPVEKISIF